MNDMYFSGYEGPRLPPHQQMQRLRRTIELGLTKTQQEVILAYYFQDKTIPEIAAERGVHKSSVSRCLKRAERRVRRCLRF